MPRPPISLARITEAETAGEVPDATIPLPVMPIWVWPDCTVDPKKACTRYSPAVLFDRQMLLPASAVRVSPTARATVVALVHPGFVETG